MQKPLVPTSLNYRKLPCISWSSSLSECEALAPPAVTCSVLQTLFSLSPSEGQCLSIPWILIAAWASSGCQSPLGSGCSVGCCWECAEEKHVLSLAERRRKSCLTAFKCWQRQTRTSYTKKKDWRNLKLLFTGTKARYTSEYCNSLVDKRVGPSRNIRSARPLCGDEGTAEKKDHAKSKMWHSVSCKMHVQSFDIIKKYFFLLFIVFLFGLKVKVFRPGAV